MNPPKNDAWPPPRAWLHVWIRFDRSTAAPLPGLILDWRQNGTRWSAWVIWLDDSYGTFMLCSRARALPAYIASATPGLRGLQGLPALMHSGQAPPRNTRGKEGKGCGRRTGKEGKETGGKEHASTLPVIWNGSG